MIEQILKNFIDRYDLGGKLIGETPLLSCQHWDYLTMDLMTNGDGPLSDNLVWNHSEDNFKTRPKLPILYANKDYREIMVKSPYLVEFSDLYNHILLDKIKNNELTFSYQNFPQLFEGVWKKYRLWRKEGLWINNSVRGPIYTLMKLWLHLTFAMINGASQIITTKENFADMILSEQHGIMNSILNRFDNNVVLIDTNIAFIDTEDYSGIHSLLSQYDQYSYTVRKLKNFIHFGHVKKYMFYDGNKEFRYCGFISSDMISAREGLQPTI